MGKKLMQKIQKEIEEHNKKEKDKVVSLLAVLVNKDEKGRYTFDAAVDKGETQEDNRRLISALCMFSVYNCHAFRLIMNAATKMQDKTKFTIIRKEKNEIC